MNVERISASKARTVETCDRQFAFHYVWKPEVPDSPPLFYGAVFHDIARDFYKKRFQSYESFVGWGMIYWDMRMKGTKVRFRDEREQFIYKNRLRTMLQKFWEENIEGKEQFPPMAVERSFRLPITVPDLKDCVIILDGKFDLVYELPKNRIVIADYKTSMIIPTPFETDNDPQFTLYSFAAREIFSARPRVAVYYPGWRRRRTKVVMTRERTEGDYATAMHNLANDVHEIDRIWREVREGHVIHAHFGKHCNACSYQEPCSEYTSRTANPRSLRIFKYSPKIKKPKQSNQLRLFRS